MWNNPDIAVPGFIILAILLGPIYFALEPMQKEIKKDKQTLIPLIGVYVMLSVISVTCIVRGLTLDDQETHRINAVAQPQIVADVQQRFPSLTVTHMTPKADDWQFVTIKSADGCYYGVEARKNPHTHKWQITAGTATLKPDSQPNIITVNGGPYQGVCGPDPTKHHS